MLNLKQERVLRKLVNGTTEKQDGRTINALRRMGLVKGDQATTIGWHAVGELRYVPNIQVPLDWEIESWQGEVLHVSEGPEDMSEDDEIKRWTHAKEVEYHFDLYKILKFYQKVRAAQSQWINAKWDNSLDREYEMELRHSWKGNNVPWVTRIVCDAEREALNSISSECNLYYTGDIFYKWADDLVKLQNMGRRGEITTSYKFSLQDNEDEHHKFWAESPLPSERCIYAQVIVD